MGFDLIVARNIRFTPGMKSYVGVSPFNDNRYCENIEISRIMHCKDIIIHPKDEDFYRPSNDALFEIKDIIKNASEEYLPNKQLWLRLIDLILIDTDVWLYDSY
jgi:hypothetical protein